MNCPACGQENPAGFKFCGACGAALDAAVAPAREERKVITVLFADLVGFTSRAEKLDPEDVRGFLSPYYARLRHELERHGGTVEKFIGDAVVALFGAPIAHEDDPERAVRAAIAIREAIVELNEADPTLELEVRIAVNTGEALVALGARPDLGEGMASGDVVNTAARLQTAAPVDGILVGEATYRATTNVIEYRDAAPVEAKGKANPVPAWEAAAAKLRASVTEAIDDPQEAGWIERHLRPLVGLDVALAEGGDRRAEAFAAWRRFLEGVAEANPIVLVFEDLHWADDGLLDFVDYLADWASGVALLIVGTARPELLSRRPGWGGGKRNASTVTVSALAPDETAALLAALLDQVLLPAEVQAAVLKRTEGNPLFAEEYVRMLQDRGFLVQTGGGWQLEEREQLPLPETVQGMIAARLDSLEPP